MREPSPQVVIVAGPNGAGKSTAAPDVLQGALAVDHFVDADQIAAGLSGFAPETAALKAGRIMLERIEELASQRKSFAFESTLAGQGLARRIDRWLARGFAVHISYLWLDDPDLAVRRVKQRARSGGHDVPERVIRRRFWRSIRNFDHIYSARVTSWRLYDGSVPSAPRIAFRREGEQVVVLQEERWQQYRSFADAVHEQPQERDNGPQR